MKITDHFYTFLFIDHYSYKNTLLFNLSEIESFEMVKKGDDDLQYYYIQINDKNHQQSQIYIGGYYVNKNYLEKFVLLLNGKLNDINEKKIIITLQYINYI